MNLALLFGRKENSAASYRRDRLKSVPQGRPKAYSTRLRAANGPDRSETCCEEAESSRHASIQTISSTRLLPEPENVQTPEAAAQPRRPRKTMVCATVGFLMATV